MSSIFYYHADICVKYDFLKVSCENVRELKSTSLFCFVLNHIITVHLSAYLQMIPPKIPRKYLKPQIY